MEAGGHLRLEPGNLPKPLGRTLSRQEEERTPLVATVDRALLVATVELNLLVMKVERCMLNGSLSVFMAVHLPLQWRRGQLIQV